MASDATPLVAFPFGEPDARLEDFLDDKLQAADDLDALDALLAHVATQHDDLQTQLAAAAERLDTARAAAAAQHATLADKAAAFRALDARVAERLALVNADDAGPDAVLQQLAAPATQLHRVSLAHDYLVQLADVARWAGEAQAALPDDPAAALVPYTKLRRLAARLRAREGPDAAAPHLVAHVHSTADAVWAGMNATAAAAFDTVLDERGWNAGRVGADTTADDAWRSAFAKLLILQAGDVVAAAESKDTKETMVVLLPMAALARMAVREFRYHFLAPADAGRPTSEPQRAGQLCFPWFLARVDAWSAFLRRSFASVLEDQFRGTAAWGVTAYRDPANAFAAALLPVLQHKVRQTVAFALDVLAEQRRQTAMTAGAGAGAGTEPDEPLLSQPTFLGLFMGQLLTFDDALRQRGFDGGVSMTNTWPGLAGRVLDDDNGSTFEAWLRAEREHASSRFDALVDGDAPPARDARACIDYDYAPRGYTKPTRAAQNALRIVGDVTDTYRLVQAFRHRRRFLVDVQVALLDRYDARLRETLGAYAAMTSAIGGLGFSREARAQLDGTGALAVLCRVYGSAELVADTLRAWNDDAFFVALAQELGLRAGTTTDDDDDDDGLFGDSARGFDAHRAAAEDLLVAALGTSHSTALRPYASATHWTDDTDENDDDSVSPSLDSLLRTVQTNLAFLADALGTLPLRRVVRRACLALEQQLFNDVLLKARFTGAGAALLGRDVAALRRVVEHVVPSADAFAWLAQGVALLALPVASTPGLSPSTLTLADADKLMFDGARVSSGDDNAGARTVLEQLGLPLVDEAHAHKIVRRRVELY